MKYVSFDLEIEKDTLPVLHYVRYGYSDSAAVIFKDDQSTADYAAEFIVSIQSPASASAMTQTIGNIDYDKNKLKIQSVSNYANDKSIFVETTYYKPAVSITIKLVDEIGQLETMNEKCYPSVKIKNIVLDDRYESWLDSDWFSLEGIDEDTVLE